MLVHALFHFADFAHFVERAFKFAGSLFDSAWTRNCLNRRCYWDMRANDVRPTPHLAPSGLLPAVLPLRHGVVADIRAFCINVRGFVHSDAGVSITLSTVWKWLMEDIAVRCCISSITRSRHSLRNLWAAGSALRGSFSASRICFSYAVSRCCTPSRTAPEFFP